MNADIILSCATLPVLSDFNNTSCIATASFKRLFKNFQVSLCVTDVSCNIYNSVALYTPANAILLAYQSNYKRLRKTIFVLIADK